jgi:hypothetical protein
MHVHWDEGAAATPRGQLLNFADSLAASAVLDRWVSACSLEYRSGNAPDKHDVPGTLMRRCSQAIGATRTSPRCAATRRRGDAAAAQARDMNKVVSEDALRRALERVDETASAAWMRPALMHSVREAPDRPWVLDIDASIKPLHGRQEGAEDGYDARKPGTPSDVLHTFWVGNLRLALDLQVSTGKQRTGVHAKAALARLLREPGDKRPALVGGDSGYDKDGILPELESPGQPDLLRLGQAANRQRLVARRFASQGWSRAGSQGRPMVEAQLRLHRHGWRAKRRVVIVRQRIRGHRRGSGAPAVAGSCGWTCNPACTRAIGCGSARCRSAA